MGDRRSAVILHNQAVEAAKQGQDNLVYEKHCSSVYADPTFANGYFECGNVAQSKKQWLAAVACFRRALELPIGNGAGDLTLDLKGKILSNLAHNLHHAGRDDEALLAADSAIAIDPKLSFAWLNKSLVHARFGQEQEAIAAAEKAYFLNPEPLVECGYAFALMFNKQYAKGLKHFESRFSYQLPQFLSYPYPRWAGEPDKTLFLVSEQGIGDAVSCARFVEAAAKRSKFIWMMVQPELKRLFTAMFLHLKNVEVHPLPGEFKPAEYWTSFVSLPVALGLTDEEIVNAPNPLVPPFTSAPIWKSPDRAFHIGVAWAGSPINFIDKHRSFPVTQLLELSRVPGVQLYSLQVGERGHDLHTEGCAATIRDISPHIRDMADTLGIIRELDLVISVESALAHLCGLASVECWVPYSHRGRDWRLGNNENGSLWNPKHRIFMQGKDAEWSPVFERIVEALRERVK